MAKDLFNRYIWLVDTIYRTKRITFEELNERWLRNEMSEGVALPLRTFHNHRIAIQDMFDILIECDKRDGFRYYIANADDMEKGKVRTWLINTFAVNNLINESHQIKSRILFEEIPSGREHLTPIIEAMRDNLTVEITYQSFWRSEPRTFHIEPYCVKIFKQRWYVVAKSPYYNELRIYSLDRIQNLKMTNVPFHFPKDFDPEEYFNNSFGIIIDSQKKPVFVTIKVRKEQVNYFRSLPLHHSQEEVETTESHSLFKYYIIPTFDFTQELLSHGADIEILSPDFLRTEFAEISNRLAQIYKK